jgi:acetylornithine deacetylase/succinyl-diaminopimelate desuccinylase-like protein
LSRFSSFSLAQTNCKQTLFKDARFKRGRELLNKNIIGNRMLIDEIKTFIETKWDQEIIPELETFIRIPNKSPAFDPHWKKNGFMDQAVSLIKTWCLKQAIKGMTLEVITEKDRTPLIFIEIAGAIDETILLYGHLDKQPEMSGWDPDLGPWEPVLKDDKLYGRGGADDGYSAFAALTAIAALQAQKIPHARCVVLIEASEESGSTDLPYYVESLSAKIGHPNLVICLDSGCGNYEQLWSTTSLRGLVNGTLSVELLSEGVHSGYGSGIFASSFRVLRDLLSRLENEETGEILLPEAIANIPAQRIEQAKLAADSLGDDIYHAFPHHEGVEPVTHDLVELLLNRTWRAQLSITGADGLPALEDAGNVLRPKTAVKLSLRLPPTCDATIATQAVKRCLESDAPYNAIVNFTPDQEASGWHAPLLADWLHEASQAASLAFYGKPVAYIGEGGSIPFMGMLGERYPEAQFLIVGVLGPHSNAHGPNEFLHIPMAKKLTGCVASVIADHYRYFS